jgi:hypothetical protein
MGYDDVIKQPTKSTIITKPTISNTPKIAFNSEKIKNLLYGNKKEDNASFFNMLFCGIDGSGKTGVAQSYPLKEGEKMIIIDLDGGNEPLVETYHKDIKDKIIVFNPLATMTDDSGRVVIDFITTFSNIKNVIEYVRQNYEADKIQLLVIDGLSKMLKYAENQMRLDLNIDASGGVNFLYWKSRNEMFGELIEMSKALPINKIFIAHEDFIVLNEMDSTDKTVSNIKRETNRAMYQKIRFIRKDLPEEVQYVLIVDKSKYNVSVEGAKMVFLTVNKHTKEYKWEGEKLYSLLKNGN